MRSSTNHSLNLYQPFESIFRFPAHQQTHFHLQTVDSGIIIDSFQFFLHLMNGSINATLLLFIFQYAAGEFLTSFVCVDVTNDTKIMSCTMILHGLHAYDVRSTFCTVLHRMRDHFHVTSFRRSASPGLQRKGEGSAVTKSPCLLLYLLVPFII